MKVVCSSCGTRYQVDDARVAGRNLKLRCRKCGVAIVIRGAEAKALSSQGEPAPAPPSSPEPANAALSEASAEREVPEETLESAPETVGFSEPDGWPSALDDSPPMSSLPPEMTPGGAQDDPSFGTQVVLRRGPSLASPTGLLALVVALGLGVALGYVLFGGEKVKIVREVVEVPAPVAEAVPAPDATVPEAETSETHEAKVRAGTVQVAAAAAESKANEGLPGLSGLKELASGPRTDSSSSGSSRGAQLDAGQIQGVVHRYTPAVRRSCWQPLLDARDPSAPASARVTVSLTVGADGKVRSATASSDPPGYPGLSGCIVQRVRTWIFPPSSGTTTVEVPFVFAAQ